MPGPGRSSAAGPLLVYSRVYDDDPAPADVSRLEAENKHQRLVDRSELMRIESACRPTEPFGIDDGRLFDENSRPFALELDCGPKACLPGARGGG